MHLRVGLHRAHAEGEHRAQRRDACGPVQAHLYGAADGRNEETYGLQNQCWLIHYYGAFPQRRLMRLIVTKHH